MVKRFQESATSASHENASSSTNNANDAGDFECNICFELAQDPVVTLCGHLFCWPCLYRWLHHHSHCQECPVCKALVEESKLVPLYGRGKTQVDPRSKSYPDDEIPSRPTGQRPATTPPPPHQDVNNNSYYGFNLMGGLFPMASARIGNFSLSTAFVGLSLFPALLNVQFHGFPDATVYGTTSGYPRGFHGFNNNGAQVPTQHRNGAQRTDNALKNLLLFIGALVILGLICW